MNSQTDEHKRGVLSAIFLVAGTCIGGGMLALPITSGVSGFIPSTAMMGVCWLAMTLTALLLLEVSLWMKEEDAHVITMASTLLGPVGKAVAWILFLFISYASLVAYTAGGGIQIANVLNTHFDLSLSSDVGALLFITLFTGVIFIGNWFVGRINTMLFTAMIAAYFCLVGLGIDEVKGSLLLYKHWSASVIAIPLLLTAFSFQTLVPSLTPYLKRNVKKLRVAIVGGTLLAFVIYALWQWLILGIVPVEGSDGLAEALRRGDQPATTFMYNHVQGKWISVVAEYFAFFAIITSFLGIALALFDFLSDGLKVKKEGSGKWILALLVAVPTLIFATQIERVFILAMDATGGFGDTVLNGIIPVLMVWVGRYRMGYSHSFKVPGGKPLLVLIATFFLFSFLMEMCAQLGLIDSIYQVHDILEIHNEEQISSLAL